MVCSNRVLNEAEATKEWPMLQPVPQKTAGRCVDLAVAPYTSFTQLLLETDLNTSNVNKLPQTFRAGKRPSLVAVEEGLACAKILRMGTDQASPFHEAITLDNDPTEMTSDVQIQIQESLSLSSSSCGVKYPVLSRMLLSRPAVSRLNDPSVVSAHLDTTMLTPISSPTPAIPVKVIAPLRQTVITPDASPSSLFYSQAQLSPIVICPQSQESSSSNPSNVQSHAQALSDSSSHYLNSPLSTESDYSLCFYNSDNVTHQQMRDGSTFDSILPKDSNMPTLDLMMLENSLLFESIINTDYQESSGYSDIEENLEDEDKRIHGAIQYTGDSAEEEVMDFETREYSQVDVHDFSRPASNHSSGYQSEDCMTNSSSYYQFDESIVGASPSSARPDPIVAVDDLLKPGSRFAGDKRMECLLSLLRVGLASGLISEEDVRNVRKGKCGIGSKLMELKKLHQRAVSRVDVWNDGI